MCILMYFPADKQPNPDHLKNACDNNPHGYGWAIIANGRILSGHSMDADEAIAEFIQMREAFPENDALFHARITTHGTTSLDNCHPFFVGGRTDMILAHNGMMPCQPKPGDFRSDTRIFAEDVLLRDFRTLDKEKTIKRMSAWVGYSKVLILSVNPQYKKPAYLVNEGMGHWLYGVWYSNDSYKPDPWAGCYTWGASDLLDSGEWPKVIGRKPSLDDDMVYICTDPGCGRTMDYCECHQPVFGVTQYPDVYQMVNKATHIETDDIDTWWCRGCEYIGWVSAKTLVCAMCNYMYCCDMERSNCQCWDEHATFADSIAARTLFAQRTMTYLADRMNRPMALTGGSDDGDAEEL